MRGSRDKVGDIVLNLERGNVYVEVYIENTHYGEFRRILEKNLIYHENYVNKCRDITYLFIEREKEKNKGFLESGWLVRIDNFIEIVIETLIQLNEIKCLKYVTYTKSEKFIENYYENGKIIESYITRR